MLRCLRKLIVSGMPFILFLLLQGKLFSQQKKFLLPPRIHEASGLVAINDDSLLWVNDSGNPPLIFMTDLRGRLLDSIHIEGAQNRDWEDLSWDRRGNIFIGDVGNNCHCREDLVVYRWNLFSHRLDSIAFAYDSVLAKNAFGSPEIPNLEGFYWSNDSLHLFTKGEIEKKNYGQIHAVLVPENGKQIAKALSYYPFAYKRVVTGAAIRGDGKEFALLTYTYGRILGLIPYSKAEIYLYDAQVAPQKMVWTGEKQRIKLKPRLGLAQFEAIDYLNPDRIVVGSEKTPLFKAQGRIVFIKRK